jgi:hypothetical protein
VHRLLGSVESVEKRGWRGLRSSVSCFRVEIDKYRVLYAKAR